MTDAPILVTGGSGFVGAHLVLELLNRGHRVRTTVRNRARREAHLRELLERNGAQIGDRLEFVEADLLADEGWAEAVRGCHYVHHVASPFPPKAPRHEDELIVPARDGTLRVLRAAHEAGVERVVLTSSFAAIGYGHETDAPLFDETFWSDTDGAMTAYAKSKTLAERAAWEFAEDAAFELTVVNPVLVLGPLLGPHDSTSVDIIRRILKGMPGCPRLHFAIVDVRDLADIHIRAMTHPDAAAERFLAVAGRSLSMQEIARSLKRQLPAHARRVQTFEVPSALVRMAAWVDPSARLIKGDLDKSKEASNAKAKQTLGWEPREMDATLLDTAQSLVDLGLVK